MIFVGTERDKEGCEKGPLFFDMSVIVDDNFHEFFKNVGNHFGIFLFIITFFVLFEIGIADRIRISFLNRIHDLLFVVCYNTADTLAETLSCGTENSLCFHEFLIVIQPIGHLHDFF